MPVSQGLTDLLLATRFWPNLARDRELQVRGDNDEVIVSYGGEDLFIFGTDSGRLTCRTRPRLVPIRPDLFACRRHDAWLPLDVTATGELIFQQTPVFVELGDARSEIVSAYKKSVQQSGLWAWRRLLVDYAADPTNHILAHKLTLDDHGRLGDYAVMSPLTSEISLVSMIDVTRLLEPADWFVEGVWQCIRTVRDHKAEVLSLVRRESSLRRRLGCAEPSTLSGDQAESLSPTLCLRIGNCSREQISLITEFAGPWSWLAEVADLAQFVATPR